MKNIILAAGRGTRMKETIPKVLINVENKPMIERIIDNVLEATSNETIVVVGNNYPLIYNLLHDRVKYVHQQFPSGTADALKCALPLLEYNDVSLILPADIPYISASIIKSLVSHYKSIETPIVVGMKLRYPKGYGRIIHYDKYLDKIIEDQDASDEEKCINIINTGIYIIPNNYIIENINLINNHNASGEYYLTDLINVICKKTKVQVIIFPETYLLKGANDMNTLKSIINQKNLDYK